MNQKNEITSKVLKILNPNYTEKDFKIAKQTWWVNPRTKEKGGLQLTEEGFNSLVKADIKHYKIKLEEKFKPENSKIIIWLDNHINGPFYFWNYNHTIITFDEKTAVQVVLFNGNITKLFRASQRFSEKVID